MATETNEIQFNNIDYINLIYGSINVDTYNNFDHNDINIDISRRILFLTLKSIYHINNNTIEAFLEENTSLDEENTSLDEENTSSNTLKCCYSFIKTVMFDILNQKIDAFNNLVNYMLYNDTIDFAKLYFWYLSIFVKRFENIYNFEENENIHVKDYVLKYTETLLTNPEDLLLFLNMLQSETKNNETLQNEYASLSNDLTKLYSEEK